MPDLPPAIGHAASKPMLPPRGGAVSDPPTRLQDLPVELWLDCLSHLDARGRAALCFAHPALQTEGLAARTLLAAGRAATADELAEHWALAQGSALAGRDRAQIMTAVLRRACMLLWEEKAPAHKPALERWLSGCLADIEAMDPPRRTRLLCVLLDRLPDLLDASPQLRPGLRGAFATRLLDGLCQAAEGGSVLAVRAVAQAGSRLAWLVQLEHGEDQPLGRNERAAQYAGMLARRAPACCRQTGAALDTVALLLDFCEDKNACARHLLPLIESCTSQHRQRAVSAVILLCAERVSASGLRHDLLGAVVRCAARCALLDRRGAQEAFLLSAQLLGCLAGLLEAPDRALLATLVAEEQRRLAVADRGQP